MAQNAGVAVELDSAGTGDWHKGESPYPPMQKAALARGYDLSALRARQLCVRDFYEFDLILAMDAQNLADARQIMPSDATARLALYLPESDVPDPYFTREFDECLSIIENGARDWLNHIQLVQ